MTSSPQLRKEPTAMSHPVRIDTIDVDLDPL